MMEKPFVEEVSRDAKGRFVQPVFMDGFPPVIPADRPVPQRIREKMVNAKRCQG